MRLTLTTFLTLDGVMQAPGGPEEDRSGGFEHGGWQVPHVDEDVLRFVTGLYDRVDAFLLGRRTYDIFAGHWPRMTDENDPIASRLNTLPKYVVSTTLDSPTWHNTTVISTDVVEEIRRVKERPGDVLLVHGSGGLAQTLMAHELVDEYRLLTFPVVLGSGRRLFERVKPAALRLLDATTTTSGAVIATYQPEGAPQYGSFALEG